jgi:hypothetical protein
MAALTATPSVTPRQTAPTPVATLSARELQILSGSNSSIDTFLTELKKRLEDVNLAGETIAGVAEVVVGTRQLESAPDPEVSFTETNESLLSAAIRKVVGDEIRQLLAKTASLFDAVHDGDADAIEVAARGFFQSEPEDSLLCLRVAEHILAKDDLREAAEDFLEEVYDQVEELQFIISVREPEAALDKAEKRGYAVGHIRRAAAEEAIRLDLAQRLASLTTNTSKPTEVDETFAELIAESKKAAEAQRRKRADFRRTLSQKSREWKGREGRRFSKSPNEPSDEEFLSFLAIKRGNAYVEQFLLTRDTTAQANQLWTKLKARLAASTDYPEDAVAQNATAMRDVLDALAQLRSFHAQLDEMDREPEGTEGASWINELHFISKRGNRGPRGMRHWLRQIRPL